MSAPDRSQRSAAITSRVIASSFSLVSFAAALFVGAAAGNPLTTVLLRALFVMIGCYAIGLIIGAVAQRTVQQHVDQYIQSHPIPEPGDMFGDQEENESSDADGSSVPRNVAA